MYSFLFIRTRGSQFAESMRAISFTCENVITVVPNREVAQRYMKKSWRKLIIHFDLIVKFDLRCVICSTPTVDKASMTWYSNHCRTSIRPGTVNVACSFCSFSVLLHDNKQAENVTTCRLTWLLFTVKFFTNRIFTRPFTFVFRDFFSCDAEVIHLEGVIWSSLYGFRLGGLPGRIVISWGWPSRIPILVIIMTRKVKLTRSIK